MSILIAPVPPGIARLRASVLARNSWFTALGAGLQQEIVRRSVLRRYAARSLVYAAGAQPAGCFVVLAGEVRLEHLARSGKFAFYQSTRASELFGLLSEIDGSPRFSDARAWTDSLLMHLPHAECQDLYRNDAAARQAFVALLCQQLHVTLDILVEEHTLPPRRQVANILVALVNDNAEAEGLRLTHDAIAAMAGVSRPTVAKVLHEFRALGLIAMQYGKVRLLDAAALKTLAVHEPRAPAARGRIGRSAAAAPPPRRAARGSR